MIDYEKVCKKLDEIKSIVEKNPRGVQATLTYESGKKVRRRLAISTNGGLMYMYPRSRSLGCILNGLSIRRERIADIQIKVRPPVEERWMRNWTKVLERLRKSGLWADVAKDVEDALAIGYEKINTARVAYWRQYEGEDREQARGDAIKQIDPRLVNDKGYPRTSIIWYMYYPAKIKKMYFGKRWNKMHLATIAQAMRDERKCEVIGYSSYDVSFGYDPTTRRAWYSEEYRNCGNGHYYLALDATHALFYEDD